ncbi:MAG: VOC family protein [Acidimicrobiales bacterium]
MFIEHVNMTVRDPRRTADVLQRVFGWRTRWEGPSLENGRTIHVGTDTHYLALYTHPDVPDEPHTTDHDTVGGLNHVGVVVDDLDAVERRVLAEGITTFNHADYEPGRRFYFLDGDGVEYEVVSYT